MAHRILEEFPVLGRSMVAAAALLLAAVALPARAQSGDPIKIGFITELSGPWSFYGTSCKQGMQFAEKRINASGGVLGRPLKFIVADDQTNPAQSVAAARSLDIQDKVLALSGPTSSDNALSIYGYAEQNKLPFVVPVAAFPQLTRPGTHYTFRVEPDAVGWGYAAVKFIEHEKPGAKLALMYSDFALMRAEAAGIKYQAARSHITIVADVVFPQGSNDATVQAAQVIADKPDFVLVSAAGAFESTVTNQLIDLGLPTDHILHAQGTTMGIFGLGPRSAGSFYGSFFDANLPNVTPEGRQFVAEFTQQVGRVPSYLENNCYVTPYIIKAAIEKAGTVDREKFRDALSSLKMTEPTLGIPIAFDKNGARMEYMYYMQLLGVGKKDYKAKESFYTRWDPDAIPVYTLMK